MCIFHTKKNEGTPPYPIRNGLLAWKINTNLKNYLRQKLMKSQQAVKNTSCAVTFCWI